MAIQMRRHPEKRDKSDLDIDRLFASESETADPPPPTLLFTQPDDRNAEQFPDELAAFAEERIKVPTGPVIPLAPPPAVRKRRRRRAEPTLRPFQIAAAVVVTLVVFVMLVPESRRPDVPDGLATARRLSLPPQSAPAPAAPPAAASESPAPSSSPESRSLPEPQAAAASPQPDTGGSIPSVTGAPDAQGELVEPAAVPSPEESRVAAKSARGERSASNRIKDVRPRGRGTAAPQVVRSVPPRVVRSVPPQVVRSVPPPVVHAVAPPRAPATTDSPAAAARPTLEVRRLGEDAAAVMGQPVPLPPADAPPVVLARDRPAASVGESAPVPTGTAGRTTVDPAGMDREKVRGVLSLYQRAYSELDAGAAARLYPGVDRRALSRAFSSLSSQQIRLEDCRIELLQSTAQATCAGTASWTPKVGAGSQDQARRWQFDLKQVAGNWQIDAVKVR